MKKSGNFEYYNIININIREENVFQTLHPITQSHLTENYSMTTQLN